MHASRNTRASTHAPLTTHIRSRSVCAARLAVIALCAPNPNILVILSPELELENSSLEQRVAALTPQANDMLSDLPSTPAAEMQFQLSADAHSFRLKSSKKVNPLFQAMLAAEANATAGEDSSGGGGGGGGDGDWRAGGGPGNSDGSVRGHLTTAADAATGAFFESVGHSAYMDVSKHPEGSSTLTRHSTAWDQPTITIDASDADGRSKVEAEARYV
jgi:hypothetical protein